LNGVNAPIKKTDQSIEQITARMVSWAKTGDTATFLKKHLVELGTETGRTRNIVDSLSTAFASSGINTGLLGRALAAVTSPIGLVAVGLAGVAVAFHAATSAVLENARQVKALMAVSGLAAAEADNLADTFEVLGHDVGALTGALFKMGQAIDTGGKDLRDIGINLRKNTGELKSEGELFLEVRDRISEMGTASERSGALMAIFGRQGRELASVFAMSREEFKRWMGIAGDVSAWTADQQKATEEYGRQIRLLSKQWEGFWIAVGTPLVSTGTGILQWINETIDAAKRLGDILGNTFANISTSFDRFLANSPTLAKLLGGSAAVEDAIKRLRDAGLTSDTSVTVPAAATADVRVPPEAAEAIKKLRQQLELLRAVEEERPLVKLRQDFEDFAEKWEQLSPKAVADAKAVYGGLVALTRLQISNTYAQQAADAIAAYAEVVAKAEQDVIDATRDAELERIQLASTTEEAQIAAINAEAQARIAALSEESLATKEGAAAAIAIWTNALTKITTIIAAAGGAVTAAAKEDLARLRASLVDLAEADEIAATAASASTDIWAELSTALGQVEQEAIDLGHSFGETLTSQIREVELAIRKARVAGLTEDVARLKARLVEIKGPVIALADALDKAFADRQLQINALNTIATAQERFFQQGLEGWAAQSRAIGDTAGFFQAEFTTALTRGNDLWSGLTRLAQDGAQTMQRFLSDHFVDPTKVQFADLANAARRMFADFLSSQIMRKIGEAFAGVFNLGSTDLATAGAAAAVAMASTAASAQALAVALNNAAVAAGGTAAPLQLVPGNGGTSGGGFGIPGFGGAIGNSQSFLSSFGGWLDNLFGTGGQSVLGPGVVPGFFEEALRGVSDRFSSLFDSLGGFNTALGVAGVALSAFHNIMSIINGNVTQGAFGLGGMAAGGIAGFALGGPGGALLGATIGGFIGNLLGGLFGSGPSAEWLTFHNRLAETLQKEADAANALAAGLAGATTLDDFAKTVDAFKQSIEAAIPGFLAATGQTNLGSFGIPQIPGATGTEHEGGISVNFGPGIDQLNAAIRIVLRKFADQFSEQAAALATSALPAEAMQAFVDRILTPLTDWIANAQSNGATVEDIKAKMALLTDALITFGQIDLTIKALAMDAEGMQVSLKAAVTAQLAAMDLAVEDAQNKLRDAIDPADQLAAIKELAKASTERYALEKKLIEEIQATIATILQTFGSQLLATAQVAVNLELAMGHHEALTGLLFALEAIQQSSASAAVKLWAAEAALAAIVAAVPSAMTGFGGLIQPSNVGQIPALIYQAALPSLTTLADLFGQALGAGDLEGALTILNQGAGAIQALGQAAVAAVQQWEQQAVAAANTTAQTLIDAINAGAQAEIDRINATMQAQIDANDVQIEALNEQKSALQEQINLSREWARAAESLKGLIRGLLLGTSAPINPADQLALARSFYEQARATFAANQTPENLAAVQQAAQAYLEAASHVFTRPSPEYVEIFNSVVTQLQALQAIAEARVTPEEQAQAALDDIDAQIKALNDSSEAIREQAAAQVKAIETARDANVSAIEQARDAQVAAIHDAARATIEGINKAVGDIMGQIAAKQAELIGQLIAKQIDLQNAITGGLDPQSFLALEAKLTADRLLGLQQMLYAALTGGTPPVPLAAGGIVTGPTYALLGESGAEAVIPLSGADAAGAGATITVEVTQNFTGPVDEAMIRRAARVVVREIKRELRGEGGDLRPMVKGLR
jgi:hypothetical protein